MSSTDSPLPLAPRLLRGLMGRDRAVPGVRAALRLTVLALARTRVTEAGLAVLERMKRLRQVDVHQTNIPTEALERVSRQSHITWLWGAP